MIKRMKLNLRDLSLKDIEINISRRIKRCQFYNKKYKN